MAALLFLAIRRRRHNKKDDIGGTRASKTLSKMSVLSIGKLADTESDISFPALVPAPLISPRERHQNELIGTRSPDTMTKSNKNILLLATFDRTPAQPIEKSPYDSKYDQNSIDRDWTYFYKQAAYFVKQSMDSFPLDISLLQCVPFTSSLDIVVNQAPCRFCDVMESFNDIFFAHFLNGRLTSPAQVSLYSQYLKEHFITNTMENSNTNDVKKSKNDVPSFSSTLTLVKTVAELLRTPTERDAFFSNVLAQDIALTGQDLGRMFENYGLPVDEDAIYGFLEHGTELFFKLKALCLPLAFYFPVKDALFDTTEMINDEHSTSPLNKQTTSHTLWPGLIDTDKNIILSKAVVVVDHIPPPL